MKINGLIILPYKMPQRILLRVIDKNGVALASGFESLDKAVAWIDG